MLLSFKGSVCLYQGEELGLPEADLLFEELTDPPGIRFWPEYKGRDGCRTPMPWDEGEAPNGFSTGKPWLPVKPEHSALNVAHQNADPDSVLSFYPYRAGTAPIGTQTVSIRMRITSIIESAVKAAAIAHHWRSAGQDELR